MIDSITPDTLVAEFLLALENVPGVSVRISEQEAAFEPYRADYLIGATIGGRDVLLVAEVKRTAYPRDVREAIWQLRNVILHMDMKADIVVPVVIADTISPGGRSQLQNEAVGFFDRSGSLYVPAPGAFLYVEKPARKQQARKLTSLFVGRRAQTLHAVWLTAGHWFGVHEIAERASVSPTTVSQTLIALERTEWVEVRGSGPAKERRLSSPRALLDAWAAHQSNVKPKPLRHYYARASEVGELVRRLDRACDDHDLAYEITGLMGGQVHAPHLSNVTQVHCRLQAGHAQEAVLETIDARPVREGWNLALVEQGSHDPFVFRQRIDDAWFADPLQTYLDLLQAGGRSKELAEHLRLEKLGV
ncbi:hypothetical protein ACTJJ7_11385 [Phyllobacterium sp. 22229]|uniref:HTH marR-type domain-containing protein n=1 Tax=Agrobacterium radiobacter TaxID=362 RepID=A0ABD5LML1_AGRRD